MCPLVSLFDDMIIGSHHGGVVDKLPKYRDAFFPRWLAKHMQTATADEVDP